MKSHDYLVKSLRERFYVNVPFLISRKVLEEAIFSFFKFLEEPDHIKETIDFIISPLHRRGDVGFKHRDPNDHKYNDSKDFFHYHPALFEKYSNFLDENRAVKDFVLKAKPIWEEAYRVVKATLMDAFEGDFPGVVGKIFDKEPVHLLLRFLRYDWQSSEKYLAKPHFDAGSFTLAIAESCPGLRIGSCPQNLQLVTHEAGKAVFMLASNYRKLMDTELYSPGWHDVIQLDETIIGQTYSRWAIVAFIEAHGVLALSRDETHKWYQEDKVL